MMSVSFLALNASRQFLSTVLVPASTGVNPMFANIACFGSTSTPGQSKTGIELPKRPASAYFRFVREARLNLSKDGPVVEKSKILGQQWKELPEEKKQAYIDAAKRDIEAWKTKTENMMEKLQNTKELEEYLSSQKEKRLNKAIRKVTAEHKLLLESTEKPKRYPLPHSLYIKEKMHELRAKNPDIPVSGLFTSIISDWKTLPEEKKAKYIEESDKLKADYLKAMEKWNEKITKSGQAEDLEKVTEKLKSVKGKKKNI